MLLYSLSRGSSVVVAIWIIGSGARETDDGGPIGKLLGIASSALL